MRTRLCGLLACLAFVLGACTGANSLGERGGAHPLEGQIYRVADGVQVTLDALVADAAQADFVLIGERRDNREHHRLQARLVAALQIDGALPRAVAFEMIPASRQLEIVEYLDSGGDAAGLGAAADWDASGWPDWAWYQPIAEFTLARDGQIVAADLSRSEKRAAFVQGERAFRAPFVSRTGLGEAWPPPMMVALQDELRAAHCGRPPGQVVIGMMRVQRARDAMMADRLAATAGRGGGVLIAGNGHVRNDRGVPWYLDRLRPGARSLSIGLLEVHDDMLKPEADVPYDYVWFTPAMDQGGDACETHDSALRSLL
ncbi:MAG: ChaN family lipoprotein [Pseudomonadota bacterium]